MRNSRPEPIITPFKVTRLMTSEAPPPIVPVSPDPMTDWEAVCASEVDTRRVTWKEWFGRFFYA